MRTRYWHHYLFIPLAILAIALWSINLFNLDFKFASFLYHLQGDQWVLKDYWLLEDVLHTGARKVLTAFAVILLMLWLFSGKYSIAYIERSALGYLILTAILSVITIALLKKITQIDCPWHIQSFGGDLLYFSTYQNRPVTYPSVSCFPAGHASSGYAWLGAFFLLKRYAPIYRYHGLALVLLLGVVLGATQQLRGAHFLSHDIWTLAICWFIASIFSPLITARPKA